MTEIDYDRLPEEIERLHAEAEDLADAAKHAQDDATAAILRKSADAKVRTAARLRAQIEEA